MKYCFAALHYRPLIKYYPQFFMPAAEDSASWVYLVAGASFGFSKMWSEHATLN